MKQQIALATIVSVAITGCASMMYTAPAPDSTWSNPDTSRKLSIDKPECEGDAAKAYPLGFIGGGVATKRHELFVACMTKLKWISTSGG